MRPWLLGLMVLCACAGAPPNLGGAPAGADARYDAAWNAFLADYLKLNPVRATALGNHEQDGEWPDLSAEGDRARRSLYEKTRAELDAIPTAALSAEHRLDAEVLRKKLAYFLWYEEALRPAERDPIMYVGVLADGFDPLLTREFAPAAARAKNLARRLEGVAGVVRAARSRLGRPARIFTETALRQSKGLVALVDGGFPEILAQAPEQKASVLAAAAKASPALHDLQAFLESELLPRSDGDFRVGKENLRTLGRFLLDDDVDIDRLVERARSLLAETQEEMAATARDLWPDVMKPAPLPPMDTPEARKTMVRQVLARLAEDHPTNATIVHDAADVLARATEFVRANDLVGLPDQPVKVMEMPEYQRGVAIAYCDSAGPLEARGETHVTISPTPADWPAERAASFYREYNASMLTDLIIHEAMPGHYLQLWHASRFKAVPRAIFDNGAFVEGWAVYSEWLMAEHGFGGPRVKLQRQKMLARVCANAILDYGIHAGTMDEKAALALMEGEAFQEEGEAVGKWTRARVTHGQLSTYFYGFTELLAMREAAEKGPGFHERAYHDKLLSFGSPSVHEIRGVMGL